MTRMQFLRLFRKYAVAVGVSRELAHSHILRHSLCSTTAAEHADVYAIQQRAGHKNISNTMIYIRVSPSPTAIPLPTLTTVDANTIRMTCVGKLGSTNGYTFLRTRTQSTSCCGLRGAE